MDDRVEVRINQVDDHESNQLNNLIAALNNIHYCEAVKQNPGRDYVVVVEPATVSEIKKVLSTVLKIVEVDRISIDT